MATALFASPDIELTALPGGGSLLSSRTPLAEHERSVGEMLRRWAVTAGDRLFIAERDAAGAWRRVTYAEARRAADAIAQALLDRGLGPQRPVAVLSGNSVDHALLMLGCFTAGVPIVPVSAAYSLGSRDFARLRHVLEVASRRWSMSPMRPRSRAHWRRSTPRSRSSRASPRAATARRRSPSCSTPPRDLPWSWRSRPWVPTPSRRCCSRPAPPADPRGSSRPTACCAPTSRRWPRCGRSFATTPPILVDWLPWSHTFGGSHDFNMVLKNGGSLYIDGGRPVPGLLDATVRNLREVSPTVYFNVPAGFAALLPALETDDELAARFFARLQSSSTPAHRCRRICGSGCDCCPRSSPAPTSR